MVPESLSTFDSAVHRIAHDTLVHLVRDGAGQLLMVRVAVPQPWDRSAFATALARKYADRGLGEVEVQALPTDGEPRLLSVVRC